jgi:hypothetical protein
MFASGRTSPGGRLSWARVNASLAENPRPSERHETAVITDFQLLEDVLDEVADATRMAVLHREPEVAAGAVTSDVDLCVADDPLFVVGRIVPKLEDQGILVIMVFHHDRGSYSVFFANPKGSGGAQIDLLHDPKGVGRYGVRTSVVIASRRSGARWPRTADLDETLYVLRKAQVKGDVHRVAHARRHLESTDVTSAMRRGSTIFSPRAATAVATVLRDANSRDADSIRLWRSRVMRPLRLIHRCGYWAHVTGDASPQVAERLRRRTSRLISAVKAKDPSLGLVVSHLWRPYLIVSVGSTPFWPHPDLVLRDRNGDSVDELSTELFTSMHKSVVTKYGLTSARRAGP